MDTDQGANEQPEPHNEIPDLQGVVRMAESIGEVQPEPTYLQYCLHYQGLKPPILEEFPHRDRKPEREAWGEGPRNYGPLSWLVS